MAGLKQPEKAQVILDRAAAIRQAVHSSGPGDIILVAGKGHEAWQESKGQKIAFSDEEAVNSALEDAA